MKKLITIIGLVFLFGIVFITCKKSKDDEPVATCTDGIKNGVETHVDCGGNCPTCQCPSPSNLHLNGPASSTQAAATWNSAVDATEYNFRYKAISDTVWMSFTRTDTLASMGSLQSKTTYEFEVSANCSYGNTSSSVKSTFTTP